MTRELDALKAGSEYLDSLLQFQQHYFRLPGIAAAITFKGKTLLNQAYGYANIASSEKLTVQHLFRIASHSKMFTAIAILQLKEQGLLRLDDQVSAHLKWFKSKRDKNIEKITIRELLAHTSGLIRDGLNTDFWQLLDDFPNSSSFKKAVSKSRLITNRFEEFRYSNFGYSVLGFIIEQVSGAKYADYCLKQIVKPLKLKNTFPDFNYCEKWPHAAAHVLDYETNERVPVIHTAANAMSAATGFSSSALDLCRFLTALSYKNNKLINDTSKSEAFYERRRIDAAGYGLGFQLYPIENKQFFGHGGGFPGFSTMSIFEPKMELAISLLFNTTITPTNFIDGITRTLIYFLNNYKKSSKFKKYAGRFRDVFGVYDFVNMGEKLIEGYPILNYPFQQVALLKHTKDHTFVRSSANPYDSSTQPIKFVLSKSGDVSYISEYTKLYPLDEYNRRVLKKVGLT